MEANESPIREVGINQKDKSTGFRTRKGFFYQFAAESKSKFDIVFPYDIDLMSGDYYIPTTAGSNNRLWVEIAPNLDLTLLAAPAGTNSAVVSGDTEITVNGYAKAVLDSLLTADSNMQTQEIFFRLTSVPTDETDFTDLKQAYWDSDSSKLKSYNGSAFGLTADSGAKIFTTLRWEDGSYIAPGTFIRVGEETIGSSQLPKNVKLRIIIENEDASPLDMGFNLTYLHS